MAKHKQNSFFIVGIGSSAGGLEALQQFLKNAPSRDDLAYIIAQHLSPTHKSMLTDLLSKSSSLKTIEAKNGMSLQGKTLYVTPPNKNIKVIKNIIHLLAPAGESYTAKPSIDTLFRSLADSSDSKPIGVLLSGTGSDGTQGLISIKESDGITVVQDPNTAKYDGMPRSAISARAADIILPPEKIGGEIVSIIENFVDGVRLPKQQQDISEYSKILEIIYRDIGVDLSGYKKRTIERRIHRRMTALKITSLSKYLDYMGSDINEVKALFQDILIGVTEFFRDRESFDELKKEFEKYILNRLNDKIIRVWIVGVSSGEEAYSVGIVIKEILKKNNLDLTLQIFATDIDDMAISKARRGRYELSQIQNIDDEILKENFDISEDKASLNKEMRDKIIFSKHNVISDPPFNKLDLIVCRNLLIYFESDLQKRVISSFHYALKDSGVLFLGKSETIGQLHYLFSPLSSTHKIFKREVSGESMRNQYLFRQQKRIPESSNTELKRAPEKSLEQQFIESIGEQFMPKSLLINDAYDIIYVKERLPYLNIAAGHTTLNIFKTIIPELSLELRTLIHKAKKSSGFCSGSFQKVRVSNRDVMLKISVLPFSKDSNNNFSYFIINFQEEDIREFRATKAEDIDAKSSEAIEVLQDELSRTKIHLQAVIEELETSNEELQSTNEELQSSNEELQSTNEELETSNEELQSTNEELQTTYAELKAISEENSRQKMIVEESLQKLQSLHEETQNKEHLLNGILESSLCGIAVLCPIVEANGHTIDFAIKKANKRASGLLNTDQSEISSKTLLELFPTLTESKLWSHLITPPPEYSSIEIDELFFDEEKQHRWFDIAITPIDEGLVITFHNTTKVKDYEEQLKLNLQRLDLSLKSANIGTWELFLSDNSIIWDDMMFKIHGADKNIKLDYSAWRSFVLSEDIDRVENELKECIEGNRPFETRFRIVWQNGEIRHIYATAHIIKLESGEARLVGINQDITEEVKLHKEVELYEDSRNKLLKDLLSSIAHHWRQPLNAISLMAMSIEEDLDEKIEKSTKESIDKIHNELQYLSNTITLFAQEYGSHGKKKFLLSESISSSLKLLDPIIKQNNLSINLDIGEDIELDMDHSKFLEIISNLVINSTEAKKRNGKESAEALIKSRKIGESYIITFEDNCGGVQPELMPQRLFEPYMTTKDKSRDKGLGLYISKYIVEHDLKGSISVQNTPNGAKFIITIPFEKKK